MVSRVNFLETTPDRIEDVARVVREVVHPGISGEPGYVGYIVLGDRQSGNALGVTLWETDEARKSSERRLERSGRASKRAPAERCATSGSTTSFSSTCEWSRKRRQRSSVEAARLANRPLRCRVVKTCQLCAVG